MKAGHRMNMNRRPVLRTAQAKEAPARRPTAGRELIPSYGTLHREAMAVKTTAIAWKVILPPAPSRPPLVIRLVT